MPGKRSTVEAYLPEHRRDPRHLSREHWIRRVGVLGSEVVRLAEAIFDSDDVLLQPRMLQQGMPPIEQYPAKRAHAAARRALHFDCLE